MDKIMASTILKRLEFTYQSYLSPQRGSPKTKKQKTAAPWQKNTSFAPDGFQDDGSNSPPGAVHTVDKTNIKPIDFFEEYFDDALFDDLALCTNQRIMKETGRSACITASEMKRFFGVSIIMGCLNLPRIRMYWERETAVPIVRRTMRRDRYFQIRAALKIVDDDAIDDATKERDRAWKIRPLLIKIRETCLTLPRSEVACIDEQMIPFTGHSILRQHVPGKPNPTGLKMFVIASPDGLAMDFHLYLGAGTYPEDLKLKYPKVSVSGLSVLMLTESLTETPCNSLTFDKFFTTIPLIEALPKNGICSTGPLMKNRVPKQSELLSDKEMKKMARGTIDQVVNAQGTVCLVKWKDNNTLVMASSEHDKNPVTECRRWSAKLKQHIDIACPQVIQKYNENMGGVDLLDRMIGFYRISARTRRWTVWAIFHMVDFVLANCWIEYKQLQIKAGLRSEQLLAFRMAVAHCLLATDDGSDSSSDDSDSPLGDGTHRSSTFPPPSRVRRQGAKHMPVFVGMENASRCRYGKCQGKSFIKCEKCQVFLCVKRNQNCFRKFHLE